MRDGLLEVSRREIYVVLNAVLRVQYVILQTVGCHGGNVSKPAAEPDRGLAAV